MRDFPIGKYKQGEDILPAFWTALTADDVPVLQRQMRGRRFSVDSVLAVATRCSKGFPQVVVSSPISPNGTPFPTIFWLTCPYLDRRCGALESEQQITVLESVFATMPDEIKKMHREYAALRVVLAGGKDSKIIAAMSDGMRRTIEESGVGGINWHDAPHAAKCLHLQTATWLGIGAHPAQKWLSEKLCLIECVDGMCAVRTS